MFTLSLFASGRSIDSYVVFTFSFIVSKVLMIVGGGLPSEARSSKYPSPWRHHTHGFPFAPGWFAKRCRWLKQRTSRTEEKTIVCLR